MSGQYTRWPVIDNEPGDTNQHLSNLLAPTAINEDLLPGLDNDINLGSPSLSFAETWTNKLKKLLIISDYSSYGFGDTEAILTPTEDNTAFGLLVGSSDAEDTRTLDVYISSGSITGTSSTATAGALQLYTGYVNDGSGASGDMVIATGDNYSSGDSGDINIFTGSSNSIRGKIDLSAGIFNADFDNTAAITSDIKVTIQRMQFILAQSTSNFGTVDAILKSVNANALFLGTLDEADTATIALKIGTGSITGASSTANSNSIDIASGKIVDGSGTSGAVSLRSGATITGGSGVITVKSGNPTTGRSGDVFFNSGTGTTGSGDLDISSGSTTLGAGNSGGLYLYSGSATSTGSSGELNLATGSALGSGNSGDLSLITGLSSSGTRGALLIDVPYVDRQDSAHTGKHVRAYYYAGITLTASQTDAVVSQFTVAVANCNAMQIDYVIKEATTNATRTGTIYVCSDGTNTSIVDTNTETADPGVTWTADINTGNLRVKYTTTANNKNMNADVKQFRV